MSAAETVFDTNDRRLTANDVGQIENGDEAIRFFARLGYNVDDAVPVAHSTLGLDTDNLQLEIKQIQRIAADPDLGDIVVYLLQVRAVTVTLVQAITRKFRTRPELALLLLTTDYETLDFVLLDRSKERADRPGRAFRQVLRPRTLTVNRRKPTSVALRVLSRFTWTEDDSDLQWEKLRAAFALAEWTEEYFNNRALFSDYYLKERLTDPALSPVWHEDVRPLGSAIFPLVTAARQKFTSQPEAAIRQGFFAPIFQLLGFDAVVNKPGDADGTAPDYFLYAPGDRSQPLAAVLTYVWNRNLDDIDPGRDTETPDGIPGALVVSTLEHKQAPWVIVTNGKTWRLYAAAADNKATNYYEVDLEEAFAAQDQVTALKYWWLFFRHAAFTGFLAGLQQQSAAYAKQLGERLKGRVFEEIFPHFAAGFIADMRARGAAAPPVAGPPNEFGVCYEKPAEAGWRGGEIDLDLVFQATLTFLYRLIFVAYAESLELLPVTESHGYGAQSLRTLKAEVAANGGAIEDAAPAQLERAYAASSTALYGRLQTLFRAIDAGAPTLNLPTYNGGLFSADTPAGQFLAAYAVPDRHLALGLDRLCRDVDDKTHALVFVDFKSLGVRQLGSIYEGLLEFKVRIAREALAVVKEGGKELYVPLAQAGSKRVLATLAAGDVYLENDKCERKATGSYYTPDYIVKYIVAHTVGPVLERKFDELAPRLHDAQKRYRQSKAVVVPKGQNPEMFWNDEALHLLADACLDVKVLDPAMGSGHFLVEAVDYLSDRLIDWLNGWSENPVWALLERTRGDILADMERQQVSIAGERLVRVALLKRAVLKRCIYGVDLNAMAVELAKVSLWLDAFTLGAPLSFLDHHLKQGNSLIGSRVGEVQAALQKRERERQMFLFTGNKFAGMFAAVEAMRLVSYLSDNTVEQVQASRTSYSEAVGYVAPFKRTLDVYISRWFGNPDGRAGSSPTLDFLDSPDTEPWIERPTADNLARLGTDQHRVAETSLHSATEKQFFHWELEFPEVFFVQSEQSKASIQLREEGGFDAVVGNPPYDELSVESLGRPVDERDFMKESDLYAPGRDSEGRLNWYHFFMMRGTELLRNAGRVGYIVPMSWMGDSFTLGVRKWLIEKHTPQSIDAFPQKDDPHNRVFMEAKLPTSIFIAARNTQSQNMRIRVHPGKDILPVPYYSADVDTIKKISPQTWVMPLANPEEWALLSRFIHDVKLGPLSEYGASPTSGEIIFNAATRPFMTKDDRFDLILRGSHVQRYEIAETAKQGEPEYLRTDDYLRNAAPDSKAFAFHRPRIVYQEGSAIDAWRRVIPTYLAAGNICGHKVCYFTDYKVEMQTLLAVFASSLVNWLVEKLSVTNSLPAYLIGNLPFPVFTFDIPDTRRAELAADARALYIRSLTEGHAGVLAFSAEHLALGASDVVHDLLAFLAEQMIDLNRRKQAEVRRFLAWLEGRLAIIPKGGAGGIDSLSGKTILQNYLGDYQKDEPACTWDDFFYRLHQNRRRFHVTLDDVQGEIQREFEASLAVLRPLKQQLASTDTLIDKIVYQLYGLTDAEIELIERPYYEQALAAAKQQVLDDKTLADDEARLEALAGKVQLAGERLQTRVNLSVDEAALAAALPGVAWLTDAARTFLLSAEFLLRTLPPQLDFAPVVLSYAKAVEQMLGARLFARFRDESGATAAACKNKFLQEYMAGTKHLTLGSMSIILQSEKETALRAYANRAFVSADASIFGASGVAGLIADAANLELRNRAAHDTVLTRADALQARAWALGILRLL